MLSTPSLSFGCLNLAFLGGYEVLPALFAAAAFPCSAAIPAAPKRAAVTTTAAAASNTGRPVRDSLSRTRFFIVLPFGAVDLSWARDTGEAASIPTAADRCSAARTARGELCTIGLAAGAIQLFVDATPTPSRTSPKK